MTKPAAILAVLVLCCGRGAVAESPSHVERIRLIIETDAGGDPDDEQSLVRFLLYANDFDIEGIIANREHARKGENLNTARTGDAIVRRLVEAYGECQPRLVEHDPRYPPVEQLRERTVAGYDEMDDGVELIIRVVDADDPRPVWYSDWGTDHMAAENNLRRALDRVLAERGPEGYAAFKNKLRLSSTDRFAEHTTTLEPAFPLWVDTWRPHYGHERWYWQFSEITRYAGGFDLERDCRTGHGPLGALYPTNTTHIQKEGDTGSFLYLVPTGMNDPQEPGWGSWAGRYGPREDFPGKPYFWANQQDDWNGSVHRDNTLARWAAHLQNDFKARLDWCVQPREAANHHPVVQVEGDRRRTVRSGDALTIDASASSDPDGDELSFRWEFYPEAGTYDGSLTSEGTEASRLAFIAPQVAEPADIHLVLSVTDAGEPPLTRYARVIVRVEPKEKD
ncbi:MAG: DUF1593 domain-containing protein [Planctomyces sp.]|nr:DUF1593 domain-containing protein [Planctomyces sp.]